MFIVIHTEIYIDNVSISDDIIEGILVQGPWVEHPEIRDISLFSGSHILLSKMSMRLRFIESGFNDDTIKIGIL